ncbi:MAG: DNA polymerase subunit beta [Oscillatoriales cyanobacterium]|nr:MAG: DNA polymerase subunit beta [Oscillatoriales cyanobacterium]
MTFKQQLLEKRQEILEIATKHGAFNLRIFGSVAREEETPDSDIDLLIDYDIDRVSPWFPTGLMHDLQDLLGHKVDVVTEKGLKPRVRENILNDCISL